MSMQDPISDMLTRIRNGQRALKESVRMPASRQKQAIAELLKREGYIEDFRLVPDADKPTLEVALRYHQGQAVIAELKRVSRPGLRVYVGKEDLPKVNGGLGVAIVSTSRGLLTDRDARKLGVGGEVVCTVF